MRLPIGFPEPLRGQPLGESCLVALGGTRKVSRITLSWFTGLGWPWCYGQLPSCFPESWWVQVSRWFYAAGAWVREEEP